jgi:hypothetical protein
MSRAHVTAALLAAALVSVPASATVSLVVDGVDGTFTSLIPRTPGVYGVELRGGRPGAADWEVGVGSQTSVGGSFNQGEFNWASATSHTFSMAWLPSGLSFTIGGRTVTDAGTGKGAPLLGDTLRISMVRQAAITIDTLDGVAFGQTFTAPQDLLFFSGNGWGGNGFAMNGTISIANGSGSANAIRLSVGDFAANPAIPEPATWAMMIAGFGLVGAAMRRQRPATATA